MRRWSRRSGPPGAQRRDQHRVGLPPRRVVLALLVRGEALPGDLQGERWVLGLLGNRHLPVGPAERHVVAVRAARPSPPARSRRAGCCRPARGRRNDRRRFGRHCRRGVATAATRLTANRAAARRQRSSRGDRCRPAGRRARRGPACGCPTGRNRGGDVSLQLAPVLQAGDLVAAGALLVPLQIGGLRAQGGDHSREDGDDEAEGQPEDEFGDTLVEVVVDEQHDRHHREDGGPDDRSPAERLHEPASAGRRNLQASRTIGRSLSGLADDAVAGQRGGDLLAAGEAEGARA